MANELAIAKKSAFKNPELEKATAEINEIIMVIGREKSRAMVKMSTIFAGVSEKKAYEQDGYKSAVDYIMDVFGASKANAYAYIQVGSKLNNGELPFDMNGVEFNFTQLRAMAAVKEHAKLVAAVESGAISPNMSAAEVEEAVKEINPKRKPAEKKAEKVYLWYLDSVPGRADITAPESVLASGEGCDAVQRVNFKVGTVSVVGYLVAKDGQIRFYTRGEVAPVAEVDATATANGEETEG